MAARERPVYRAIFLLVLAPIGAVVLIAALLLFGVHPPAVFFIGFAVKAALAGIGIHAPNAVGVLSTVFFWWAVIAMLGLAWERSRR
jgi:hypothetical protein